MTEQTEKAAAGQAAANGAAPRLHESGAARKRLRKDGGVRRPNALCLLVAVYLLAAAAFFFVPMAFTPDSGGYLSGALGLLDGQGFAGFSGFRGPLLPLVLAAFLGVFGRTVLAVKLTWFCFYSILFFASYHLLKTLDLFKNRRGWVTWPLFIFALALNPCVFAYGHLCLTELPALACLSVYAAVLAPLYRPERKDSPKARAAKKLAAVCGFTVLIYTIKQAAFPVVPALFAFCELPALVRRFSFKRLCACALCVALAGAALLGYMRGLNALMDGQNVEGESVSAFAGSFLVDGLRYFRVTERAVYGRPVTVEVMADDYETVEQRFDYTFDGSLAGALEYWKLCVRTSPQKAARGYVQNYMLVTGTRHLLGASGAERAYAKVNSTTAFFTGQETAAWTDAFAKLDAASGGSMYTTQRALSGGVVNEYAYNNSIQRKLLFNSYYRKLAYFQYSFISYHALLIAALSAAGMAVCKKRGASARMHRVNFACACTIFCEIAFLSLTAQGIDRYGFPLTIFCFLIAANTLATAGGWLLERLARRRAPQPLAHATDAAPTAMDMVSGTEQPHAADAAPTADAHS